MERLGGLIHRMPETAFAFLVGCVAISALPPLNGFVSEWLTFQAILLSPELPQWALKIMVPAVGGMLALSAALAAACFVKAFGITFLGRPRSRRGARRAGGRPLLARGDVRARRALPRRRHPARLRHRRARAGRCRRCSARACRRRRAWPGCRSCRSPPAAAPTTACWCSSSSPSPPRSRSWSSTASPRARVRRAPAWDCGFPDPDPATQYTAGSFAQPIRRVFGTLVFPPREQVDMPPPGEHARPRATLRSARPALGLALRPGRRRRRLRRRPAEPCCSS